MATAVRALLRASLGPLLLAASALASAQDYPARPVTLLTPVPPGGAVDRITRAWMACAEARGGQPIVLQHRPGGNGVVATATLRQAPADGHTLLVAGMSQTTIVPFTFRKAPFDPEKDLHVASIFATSPYLLVASAQSGLRNVQDLQARAKASAAGIDIGIPAHATPNHLLTAALAERLGLTATLVPTGGEAAGLTSLLGGHLPAMAFVPGTVAAQIAGGKVVPLLVFASQRLAEFPQVPTAAEVTGDATMARPGWLGIAARAGTPKPVLDAVESWTQACFESPAFLSALTEARVTPLFVPQSETPAWIRRDIAFWAPWIARLNLVQGD